MSEQPDGPSIIAAGVVRDHDGNTWVRADQVIRRRPTDPIPAHYLGYDITEGMIRGWAADGHVETRRVGRATWYRLDQLRTAEVLADEAPRGWPRGKPRPNQRRRRPSA